MDDFDFDFDFGDDDDLIDDTSQSSSGNSTRGNMGQPMSQGSQGRSQGASGSSGDGFGFDFDGGGSSSSSGSFSDSDSGDPSDTFSVDDIQFDPNASPDDSDGKKSVVKTGVIIVVAGLTLMLVSALLYTRVFNKSEAEDSVNQHSESRQETQKNPSTSNKSNSQSGQTSNNQQSSSQGTKQSSDGWSEIGADEQISFNDGAVELTFTVTNVKSYARVIGENSIEVKTVLTGSLSGLEGTYQVEVPYTYSGYVTVGSVLKAQVRIGNFNGRNVVNDIEIE